MQDDRGGAGAAGGLFDGIDVDREFPGGGMPDPGASAADIIATLTCLPTRSTRTRHPIRAIPVTARSCA